MVHHHVADPSATFSHRDVAAAAWDGDAGDWFTGRVGIVVARFNAGITDRLYRGAVAALLDAGIDAGQIDAFQVPGAIEIPAMVSTMGAREDYRALIAIGCVIRGETPHFEYVCRMAADGCREVSVSEEVPIGFGVLTCDTADQAVERSVDPLKDPSGHNVGADAAKAALETAFHLRTIRTA
jgi:6,7-dimethyl-8-ribityllumazine synthase